MPVTSLLMISAAITKSVDLVRNFIAAHTKIIPPKWVWNVLSLGGGVFVAEWTRLSLLPPVVYGRPVPAAIATVISGLALGGLASGNHELFDLLSSQAKKGAP